MKTTCTSRVEKINAIELGGVYISADRACTIEHGRHMKGAFGTQTLSYNSFTKQAPVVGTWPKYESYLCKMFGASLGRV